MQKQTAVTAYLNSGPLLLFFFHIAVYCKRQYLVTLQALSRYFFPLRCCIASDCHRWRDAGRNSETCLFEVNRLGYLLGSRINHNSSNLIYPISIHSYKSNLRHWKIICGDSFRFYGALAVFGSAVISLARRREVAGSLPVLATTRCILAFQGYNICCSIYRAAPLMLVYGTVLLKLLILISRSAIRSLFFNIYIRGLTVCENNFLYI